MSISILNGKIQVSLFLGFTKQNTKKKLIRVKDSRRKLDKENPVPTHYPSSRWKRLTSYRPVEAFHHVMFETTVYPGTFLPGLEKVTCPKTRAIRHVTVLTHDY